MSIFLSASARAGVRANPSRLRLPCPGSDLRHASNSQPPSKVPSLAIYPYPYPHTYAHNTVAPYHSANQPLDIHEDIPRPCAPFSNHQGSLPEPLMTPLQDAMPFKPPQYPDADGSITLPKQRASPASSLGDLPYRRSNPSLSTLFASTASLSGSRTSSGTATPTTSALPGSVLSASSKLNGTQSPSALPPGVSDEYRSLIQRAFVPHITVLASKDTEDILRGKGFDGGFLQLLRPFGEHVPGKVTIRDSVGASKSWDDFGVRFVSPTDGLGLLTIPGRSAETANGLQDSGRPSLTSARPRPRTGGDVQQIEEVVERHLRYSEFQAHTATGFLDDNRGDGADSDSTSSPFYTLYLRRLLSGLPLTPHETFAHPSAFVIAISSRDVEPIEELRQLYARTDTGDLRLPQWVSSECLRYYVLVHEEEHGDIAKSNQMFERMKRHFGLHCHLLRLKSQQCIPSDDDSVPLPACEWISAGEELSEIQKRGMRLHIVHILSG